MKGKLLEYGLLVGEEHQQGRRISYWNMECLLVKNTNKGEAKEHQQLRGGDSSGNEMTK
jgi:hypothetical protein